MPLKDYVFAETIEEILNYLGDQEISSQLIAGGATVSAEIRSGLFASDRLVDISRIATLSEGRLKSRDGVDYLSLGASLTLNKAAHLSLVAEQLPLLASVLLESADPARRNAYTLGGVLATRVPRGMLIPALVALDAKLVIVQPDKEEMVSLLRWMNENFSDRPYLIKEILIPLDKPIDWVIQTVMRRNYPGEIVVGVLAARSLSATVSEQKLRVFATVDTYGLVSFEEYAKNLMGQSITEDLLSNLASRIDDQLFNSWPDDEDARYRRKVVTTLVNRSILQLVKREG